MMTAAPYRRGRTRSTAPSVRYAAIVLGALLLSGCASMDARKAPMRPIRFLDTTQRHVATVYGPLAPRLPAFDQTPAIDLFLYGPNDYGKTVLRNPQGMATLGSKLLVCDQGYPDIIAIDLNTGQSLRWLDADHLPRCPVDVAADPTGRIYVADTTLRKVLIYDANGRFLNETRPVPDEMMRFRPAAMAMHQGVLHVCNLAVPAIERFSIVDQRWIEPLLPPEGRLASPAGIDIDSNGMIYIADAVGGQVERVSSDGRWLDPIGRPGRRPGELIRPKQVVACGDGKLAVSDAGRQSVCLFRLPEGTFLVEIHERPPEWNGLTLPMGLVRLEGDAKSLVSGSNGDGAEVTMASESALLIVSDSLGVDSLTLIGVMNEQREGGRP